MKMEGLTHLKFMFYTSSGVAGALMLGLLGGWDSLIQALIVLMAVDLVSGFVAAFVFGQSKKTESGRAESKAMLKGLARKGMALCIVIVGCIVDDLAGSHVFVRNAVIFALSIREVLSFVENLGLMGVPFPDVLMRGLEALYKKAGEAKGDKSNEHHQ